jgi:predicted short-subunit dehydrogenase-like oxidoreductase (DUF2520 family)
VAGLPSLALVGPGRAGRALARSWLAAGGPIAAVAGRSDLESPGGAIPGEVLVLAVPDDRLSDAASRVAARTEASLAFHLSGALPADAISALRTPSRPVGSLHPLRAFSGGEGESFAGALVAVEGDPPACDAGLAFVAAWGARGRRIDRAAKTLYHAGATLAAGGTVALVSFASRVWTLAGIPEDEARPALAELAANAIAGAKSGSFEEALTGPVARRDLSTVRAHLVALSAAPELARLYATLALETLARTPGRGREEELRALLAPESKC